MKKRSFRLVGGLLATVVGLLLLLATNDIIRVGEVLLPVVLLVGGVGIIFNALSRDGRDAGVFVGTFLILTALFSMLRITLLSEVEMKMIWPLFVTIGGIALFSYSRTKDPEHRLPLSVPAIVLVVLSGVFLLFSLNVVKTGFVAFVLSWWPVAIVAGGVLTVWSQLSGASD